MSCHPLKRADDLLSAFAALNMSQRTCCFLLCPLTESRMSWIMYVANHIEPGGYRAYSLILFYFETNFSALLYIKIT